MKIEKFNDVYRLVKLICSWNEFVSGKWSNTLRIPHIHCKDGFSFSAQAGSVYYSWPREDLVEEYKAVEIGYPSEDVPELHEYAEIDEEAYKEYYGESVDYTKQIYLYVPVEVVDMIIEKHGGIEWLGKEESA